MSLVDGQKIDPAHEERKSQIKKAALKVFAQHGLTGTKMSMIAAEAGISQGLTYRYFQSKDVLLTELVQEAVEEAHTTIKNIHSYSSTPIEQMRLLTRRMLEENHKNYFLILQQANISPNVPNDVTILLKKYSTKNIIDELIPLFVKGQQIGQFCEGDPDELLYLFFSVITGLMLQDIPSSSLNNPHSIELIMKILQ
ncbi:TetR family transcriptional regulator [Heyndrickxia sporothermodurans]|uniref:TetR/AcrR family transcriptional regulator n=1 Tax=Heyndrickxia sporothermodurans TaxID=46224 RepID=UPI000D392F0A|nr:TetR/AcrR family transcriptional regulator [Heyndrickxia sporothermodurans]PTY78956.1 TetR family transcriptional regulator [Heyndrickxia sporothermodurans]